MRTVSGIVSALAILQHRQDIGEVDGVFFDRLGQQLTRLRIVNAGFFLNTTVCGPNTNGPKATVSCDDAIPPTCGFPHRPSLLLLWLLPSPFNRPALPTHAHKLLRGTSQGALLKKNLISGSGPRVDERSPNRVSRQFVPNGCYPEPSKFGDHGTFTAFFDPEPVPNTGWQMQRDLPQSPRPGCRAPHPRIQRGRPKRPGPGGSTDGRRNHTCVSTAIRQSTTCPRPQFHPKKPGFRHIFHRTSPSETGARPVTPTR